MSTPYTGKADDRTYPGTQVDITYNARRCIHAAECVRRLATVFDTNKRPWINTDNDTPEAVQAVIPQCPSGAIHVYDKDGANLEATPERNIITLWHDGPVQISGDLTIKGATVAVEHETRVTLCRCGASGNKPFCDNAHKESGFSAQEIEPVQSRTDPQTEGGALTITVHADGPVEVEGNFEIHNAAGEILFSGDKTWLCRCGHSARKPFCDSTHKKIGFVAE